MAVVLAFTGGAARSVPSRRPTSRGALSSRPTRPQLTFRAGINFVTRRRVRVRLEGAAGHRPEAVRLRGPRGQQAADDRAVPPHQSRRQSEARRAAARARFATAIDEEREAARDDTRVFVIFLDDYHTRLGSSLAVRQPLTQFIQNQLRPLDMVAMMYPLTPVTGHRLHAQPRRRSSTPSSTSRGGSTDTSRATCSRSSISARRPRWSRRSATRWSMTALRGLSVRLGSIRDGRKSILYVSEGLQAMLPPQLRSADASQGKVGNPQAFNPLAGENDPREQTAQAFSPGGPVLAAEGRLHRRDAQQHRDLHGRSARARDQRVRHRRERRAAAGSGDAARPRPTRCARSPRKPTAAPSSAATIWPRGSSRRCRIRPPTT